MMNFSKVLRGKGSSHFYGLAAGLLVFPLAVACSDTSVTEAPVDETATTEVAIDDTVATEATDAVAVAPEQTIVDVAAGNGSFDTLVAAIQAADLAETLGTPGPYTVFAPTDEAFAALPEGLLDALLLPENKEVLTQILTYHVVPTEVPASDVSTGAVDTVAGEAIDVVASDTGVTINTATVVQTDVEASNGVIHVIDSVLIPPSVDPAAL